MLAAVVLMVLHLAAFFQADDIIMREIPGSHPYLTGLGILGGMYSFDNPLQGEPNLLQLMLSSFACKASQLCMSSLAKHCTSKEYMPACALKFTMLRWLCLQALCWVQCCYPCYLFSTTSMQSCFETKPQAQKGTIQAHIEA